MTAPFAELFGIRPWEMDLLEHWQFLTLEARAKELRNRNGTAGG